MEARNRNREKLVNAMIFFALNTNKKKIGKTKMSKLLFALDFEHFKQTGRFVTGLKYYAYAKGPYPKDVFEKISATDSPPDIARSLGVTAMYEEEGKEKGLLFKVRPKVKPNLALFSKREVEIMTRFAEIFYDATASQVTHWSHSRGSPWEQVWQKEQRKFAPIDYTYALDETSPITAAEAEALLKEEDEFESVFPTRKAD